MPDKKEKKEVESSVPLAAGNTTGNIVNNGFVAIKDGWIYFNDRFGKILSKVRPNGSGYTKVNDKRSLFLNIVDDWIYYTVGLYIFKMRTDGSEKTPITNNKGSYLNIVDDWMYFVNLDDGKMIYKARIDGSEITKLNDHAAAYLNYAAGWLYYANESKEDSIVTGIYKIKPDGTSNTLIHEGKAKYVTVIGEWVYYINKSSGGIISRTKVDGVKSENLNEEESEYIHVTEDCVYFSNVYDDNYLYKMELDGSGRALIKQKNKNPILVMSEINVAGEWLYFASIRSNIDEAPCMLKKDGSIFEALVLRDQGAKLFKVRFDDGKEYMYRTLDHHIMIGSKVKVDGKFAGLIGEVTEKVPNYSFGFEIQYINEVVTYGPGITSEARSKIDKGSINGKLKTDGLNQSQAEIFAKAQCSSGSVICSTNDPNLDLEALVVIKSEKENLQRCCTVVAIINESDLPPDQEVFPIVNLIQYGADKTKSSSRIKRYMRVKFSDGDSLVYLTNNPNIINGSTVLVSRNGKKLVGQVVDVEVEPDNKTKYQKILEVCSYWFVA